MSWSHSCRRAAELMSRSLDERLSPFDRFSLRAHLFFCRNCRHVEHQFDGIRTLASDVFGRGLDGDRDDPARKPQDGGSHADADRGA